MNEAEYGQKYFVPSEYFWEILEDTKVIPMIRGKASEYNGFLYLKNHLHSHIFTVDKLNLNAQPNESDEDVSITHRPTGYRLKVEVKNAVRGDFTLGKRAKVLRDIPHFKVKCHRSRSNMSKAETTNDRYVLGDFDLVMANTLNALYEGNTLTGELQLIDKEEEIAFLKSYYNVTTDRELECAANEDWRFAFPEDIAEDCNGILAIPRTPLVKLEGDEHWFKIDDLEERLVAKAIEKAREQRRSRRR